jgi:hypothetical protein
VRGHRGSGDWSQRGHRGTRRRGGALGGGGGLGGGRDGHWPGGPRWQKEQRGTGVRRSSALADGLWMSATFRRCLRE